VEGSYEHGNKPSGSIKCWEVFEYLHYLRLLKNGSAPSVSDGLTFNYSLFNKTVSSSD
jgi:hypothetical protein